MSPSGRPRLPASPPRRRRPSRRNLRNLLSQRAGSITWTTSSPRCARKARKSPRRWSCASCFVATVCLASNRPQNGNLACATSWGSPAAESDGTATLASHFPPSRVVLRPVSRCTGLFACQHSMSSRPSRGRGLIEARQSRRLPSINLASCAMHSALFRMKIADRKVSEQQHTPPCGEGPVSLDSASRCLQVCFGCESPEQKVLVARQRRQWLL